jgi:hypothetical protein
VILRRIAYLAPLIAASATQAQTYRCSSGGTTYLSDRPCATAPKASMGAYGPSRSMAPNPYSAPLPGAPKAQDHVKYLSADCASISEAIRTGPARGVRGDVIQGLHEEYRQKCSLEDQEAHARAQQDHSREQQLKLSQRDGLAREREQARLQSDQCGAMRDVIALKRQREKALNPKEVDALRDLERSFNQRCVGR